MVPKNILNEHTKNQVNKIKEIKKTVDRENLVYRGNEYTVIFEKLRTKNTFVRDIYNGKITIKEAHKDQSNLLVAVMNFKSKTKPQKPDKKIKTYISFKTFLHFLMVQKEFLMLLKIKYPQKKLKLQVFHTKFA